MIDKPRIDFLVFLLFAFIIGGCSTESVDPSSLGSVEVLEPTSKIELFNGRNLDGWTTWLVDTREEDPRNVYTVNKGVIRISGDGFGYLATKQAYKNYRLLVEFKWGDRNWGNRIGMARDSGIFLHSIGPDGNSLTKGWGVEELNDGPDFTQGAFKAALECQLMEGETGGFIILEGRYRDGSLVPLRMSIPVRRDPQHEGYQPPRYDPEGNVETFTRGYIRWNGRDSGWKDVFGYRGQQDMEKPVGEWNRVECICDGSRITVLVNGVKVNEAENVLPNTGAILLQCEGSEIFFRKVELHPL